MSRGDHQSLKQQRRVFALQIGFRLEREMADDDEKKCLSSEEKAIHSRLYNPSFFPRGISEPDYFSYQDVKNVPFLRKVSGGGRAVHSTERAQERTN